MLSIGYIFTKIVDLVSGSLTLEEFGDLEEVLNDNN